jgi:hypothetical protein
VNVQNGLVFPQSRKFLAARLASGSQPREYGLRMSWNRRVGSVELLIFRAFAWLAKAPDALKRAARNI